MVLGAQVLSGIRLPSNGTGFALPHLGLPASALDPITLRQQGGRRAKQRRRQRRFGGGGVKNVKCNQKKAKPSVRGMGNCSVRAEPEKMN